MILGRMKKLLFAFFFVLICATSFAQKGGIWGNISDFEMDNEPLIFAQVDLEGTSKSVQTNFHGNFEFSDVVPGNYTLKISYLGYETLEVPVVVENERITRLERKLKARKLDQALVGETVMASDHLEEENTSGQK